MNAGKVHPLKHKQHALYSQKSHTLESVIDVGQGISVGPGKFDKKGLRYTCPM